jgi:hypothetical protein
MKYDPEQAPNPKYWLSMDEAQRIALVVQHHRQEREKLPNVRLHSTLHVIIENQLTEAIPAVKEALSRLMAEGLDRHEALHAIASVLATHLFHQMKGQSKPVDPNDPYFKDLSSLTARSWREQTR